MALDPPAVALPPPFLRNEQWFLELKDIVDRLNARVRQGTGSPAGVVVGSVGDLYLRRDGGAATTLYVKESGTDTTAGWVAK